MELEINKVYNMDCLDLMREMLRGGVKADTLLTDIPYGECNGRTTISFPHHHLRNVDKGHADTMTFDMQEFLELTDQVVSGNFIIFCGIEQVSEIRRFYNKKEYTTRLLIWEKTNPSPMNGQYVYLSGIECCVWAKKPNGTFNAKCKNTVFRHNCGKNELSPTQKPLPLWYELLRDNTNEGQLVLDTCMGSFTTAIACIKMGRNFIGAELNKEQFEIGNERLKKELSQGSLFDLL